MRVLIMSHPGTNSRDIFLDAARGFEQAGHEVVYWELEPIQRLVAHAATDPTRRKAAAEDLAGLFERFVRMNRVELTVGLWANGLMALPAGERSGQAASLFEVIGVRHVLFWLDAPHWAHQGGVHKLFGHPMVRWPGLLHVVNNPATAEEMRTLMGFGRVLGRPYGIDTEVFRPAEGVTAKYDVVFGSGPGDPGPTPQMLAELARDEPDVDGITAERVDRARATLAGVCEPLGASVRAVGERLLETQVSDRHRPMLDRLAAIEAEGGELAAGVASLRAQPSAYVKVTDSVRWVERWRRAFTAAYLSRRVSVAVFGGMDLSAWGFEGEMLGSVEYGAMARTYALGRVGLNAMRWQDDVGLNLKALEVTASGVACVCERRGGLETLFDVGTEIAAFDGPADALAEVSRLLGDDDARAAMANAGMERTRREHTWRAWAEAVVQAARG